MEDWARMKEWLADAGCSEAAIRRAERLYQGGNDVELLRCLRACRCEQLDALHEKQKQLDRLDLLIRRTQKR